MNIDEKTIKEEFVKGNKGGQFSEILLITLSIPVSYIVFFMIVI